MRQRVSIEVWYLAQIKSKGIELEHIESSDLGIKLRGLGFRFNRNNKTRILRNKLMPYTVHLNGTIDASVTTEGFMRKLKGVRVIGVKFWDYKYPPQPQNCCSEGFGFITDSSGRRFLGKRSIHLTSD